MKQYAELLHIFGDDWFRSLAAASQELLLMQGCSLRIRTHEFVFRKGDPANGLFGVVEGMLAASSVQEDGRQIIFGLLEPGDWFGEVFALDGLPVTHDVHALSDTELLHIAPSLFESLMEDARFARAMAVLQAGRTRAMFNFFEDAAVRSTRSRVARRLLWLARGDASVLPRDRHVISVTHETLAMMLGLTRQTLSLELKALAATGVLSLSYGRIVIESEQALRAIGEG
jgi:CRP-like cAMP-binding protein